VLSESQNWFGPVKTIDAFGVRRATVTEDPYLIAAILGDPCGSTSALDSSRTFRLDNGALLPGLVKSMLQVLDAGYVREIQKQLALIDGNFE